MAVYFFWGEDDFAIAQAVDQIKQSVLDPAWLSFNFQTYDGSKEEATIDALNESMTPPFGMGGRLVWITEATFCNNCSESLLKELQRTLSVVPEQTHLLITSLRGHHRSALVNPMDRLDEFLAWAVFGDVAHGSRP